MLIKLGVDISRLNRMLRKTLSTVDSIFRKYGEEAVITATYEGNHSAGSLHYSNDAYDLRIPKNRDMIILDVISALDSHFYDVVNEPDHFHIEYDPKT